MSFRFTPDKFASRDQLQPFLELWLRKIFLEDWSTKLIALAITLALWFGISGQQTPGSRSLSEVKLGLILSNEIEITNEPPRQVEVTLTGDKGKLDRLDKGSLSVSVDLSDRAPGELLVELKPNDVIMDLPSGIKIDSIQPNRFLIKLEKRIDREVDVKADFEGSLPDGYEVYDDETSVGPTKVRVRGPASIVNSLDKLTTEKISLEGRTVDFNLKQVSVNLLNPKITVLDTLVDVFVKVGPKRAEKKFTVRADDPWGVSEVFAITLVGPQQELSAVDARNTRIDFEKTSDSNAKTKVFLSGESAQNIKVKSVTPANVTVKQ